MLFYDVVPGDVLPTYEGRIVAFTLATLAALAHDLWRERHRPLPLTVGEARGAT